MTISASLPSHPPPGKTSVGGTLRNGSRQLFMNTLYRRNLLKVGADKAIELRLGPLLPLLLTASALLYHQGEISKKPDPHPLKPGRMLLESGIGAWVIENTRGIYPVWGMAMAAWRAGEQKNVLDKLKTLTTTATSMALGFVGVHLFSGLSEASLEIEERDIAKRLNSPEIRYWQDKLRQHPPDSPTHLLSQHVDHLREQLNQQVSLLDRKQARPTWQALKPLKAEIAEQKARVHAHLSPLDDTLIRHNSRHLQNTVRQFRQAISGSQELTTKLARSMNPVFGYTLVGLMLGSLLSKQLHALLEARFPDLKQRKLSDLFSKQSSLMPPQKPPSPYGLATPHLPGPHLIWPGASQEIMH